MPCHEQPRASEIPLHAPALQADQATCRQGPQFSQIIQYLRYDRQVTDIWHAHMVQAQVIFRPVHQDKTLSIDASYDVGEYSSHGAGDLDDEGECQIRLRYAHVSALQVRDGNH